MTLTQQELEAKAADNITSAVGKTGFIIGYLCAVKELQETPLITFAEGFEKFIGDLLQTTKDGRLLFLLPEVAKQDQWYTLSEIYNIFLTRPEHVKKPQHNL